MTEGFWHPIKYRNQATGVEGYSALLARTQSALEIGWFSIFLLDGNEQDKLL